MCVVLAPLELFKLYEIVRGALDLQRFLISMGPEIRVVSIYRINNYV